MRKKYLILSLLFATAVVQAEKVADTAVPAAQSAATKPAPQVQPVSVPATVQAGAKSALAFQSLAQLDEMVALGMSSLALKLLDEEQAVWPEYTADWYAFEYRRISLLADSGRWQQLLSRSSDLLDKAILNQHITEQVRQWFIGQQIVAHLQLKQPEAALQKARSLLWNPPQGVDNAAVNIVLRQLIVRAYLQLDDVADAQKALQKYQQDYATAADSDANDEDWQLLQARVLLRTAHYAEAIALLKPMKSHIAKALAMLAAVRENPKAAYGVAKSAQQQLDANLQRMQNKKPKATDPAPLNKSDVWAYNYVLYERARLLNDPGQACIALEKMLALGDYSVVLDDGSHTGPDELWALYERIGQTAGNEHKLLVGDDQSWEKLATTFTTSSPIRATGLYAVIAVATWRIRPYWN